MAFKHALCSQILVYEKGLGTRPLPEEKLFIHNSTYRAVAQASEKQILQPGSFVLQAPIYNPEKLICIGMNYVDHCTEQNIPVPEEPVIFSKFNSAITEPNGPVLLSDETQVDSTSYYNTCVYVGATH